MSTDEQELQEIRDWAARKMGWTLNQPDFEDEWDHSSWLMHGKEWIPRSGWLPDTDLNQAFMLVEKVRELGWELWLIKTIGKKTAAIFCKYETREEAHLILDNVHDWVWELNPALAILNAARATED